MPKKANGRPLDETDCQLISALALGMSQEEAGEWVRTPLHPNGISDRSIRNRMQDLPEIYERCIVKISEAFRRNKQEFEQITRQQFREKLEKLRDKSVRVKETALDQALSNPTSAEFLGLGVKVADSIEDRDFGKAKQVLSGEFHSTHEHFVWTSQTKAELLAQERDILESQKLLSSAPPDAIEAEVVADA